MTTVAIDNTKGNFMKRALRCVGLVAGILAVVIISPADASPKPTPPPSTLCNAQSVNISLDSLGASYAGAHAVPPTAQNVNGKWVGDLSHIVVQADINVGDSFEAATEPPGPTCAGSVYTLYAQLQNGEPLTSIGNGSIKSGTTTYSIPNTGTGGAQLGFSQVTMTIENVNMDGGHVCVWATSTNSGAGRTWIADSVPSATSSSATSTALPTDCAPISAEGTPGVHYG